MEKLTKVVPLLPNYFKKVGIGIIVAAFLAGLTRKLFFNDAQLFIEHKAIIKLIAWDLLLVGLMMYGLSKEKTEDERISQLRLESMAFAFYFGAGQVILMPILSPLFGDPLVFQSGENVLFTMLFFYIITFLGKKQFA